MFNDPGEKVQLLKLNTKKKVTVQKLLATQKDRKERQEKRRSTLRKTLQEVPAHLTKISIDGLKYTKNEIILEAVADVFSATSYTELITQAKTVHSALRKLGCFSQVSGTLDIDGPGTGYKLHFDVTEKEWLWPDVTVTAADHELLLELFAGVPNVSGLGDKIVTGAARGSDETQEVYLAYVRPLRSWLRAEHGMEDVKWSVYVSSMSQKYALAGLRSGVLSFGTEMMLMPLPWLLQRVRWQADWRQLRLASTREFIFREQCGHSLKSSLLNQMSIDTRNDKIIPSSGLHLVASQELAGLGGDAAFFKNIIESSCYMQLPAGLVWSVSGALGAMTPIQSSNMSIVDVFGLGGSQCMRGFRQRGVTSDRLPIGGTAFWRLAVQVYFSLPFLRGQTMITKHLRGHVFGELGSLGHPQPSFDYVKTFKSPWVYNVRSCWGFGLVARLGKFARAELNYCVPLRWDISDHIAPGLQFGVGLHYS